MIYYIVAVDKFSHDEYVHSTHTSAEAAAEWVEKLRTETEAIEYRVDAIPDKHTVVSTSTNDGWKVQSFETPEFAGVPEPRRFPFTVEELFTSVDVIAYTLTCKECACEVKNRHTYIKSHTAWHNKIADL